MDYLPIQATSVPCERVFSSSAETITKKRNHLGADLIEALQILKYSARESLAAKGNVMDSDALHFTQHLITPMEDMANINPADYAIDTDVVAPST